MTYIYLIWVSGNWSLVSTVLFNGRPMYKNKMKVIFDKTVILALIFLKCTNYWRDFSRTHCQNFSKSSFYSKSSWPRSWFFDYVFYVWPSDFCSVFKVRPVMGALIMSYGRSLLQASYEFILRPSSIWIQQQWFPLWESNLGPSGLELSSITARPGSYVEYQQFESESRPSLEVLGIVPTNTETSLILCQTLKVAFQYRLSARLVGL